jgi:hypothetical protein
MPSKKARNCSTQVNSLKRGSHSNESDPLWLKAIVTFPRDLRMLTFTEPKVMLESVRIIAMKDLPNKRVPHIQCGFSRQIWVRTKRCGHHQRRKDTQEHAALAGSSPVTRKSSRGDPPYRCVFNGAVIYRDFLILASTSPAKRSMNSSTHLAGSSEGFSISGVRSIPKLIICAVSTAWLW